MLEGSACKAEFSELESRPVVQSSLTISWGNGVMAAALSLDLSVLVTWGFKSLFPYQFWRDA